MSGKRKLDFPESTPATEEKVINLFTGLGDADNTQTEDLWAWPTEQAGPIDTTNDPESEHVAGGEHEVGDTEAEEHEGDPEGGEQETEESEGFLVPREELMPDLPSPKPGEATLEFLGSQPIETYVPAARALMITLLK